MKTTHAINLKFIVDVKQYNKSLNMNFLNILIIFLNLININNITNIVLQLHSLALI